jgi:PST family polysaccharide transporter
VAVASGYNYSASARPTSLLNAPSLSSRIQEISNIRASTVSGTAWTAALSAANKVLTAAATFFVARQLAPEEYGMAGVAASVACALVVLSPLSIGDVVVSRALSGLTGRDGSRVALGIGLTMSALFLAAIWPTTLVYEKYPAAQFVPLLVVLAIRPTLDAWSIGPLTDMRLDMQFRTLALADGAIQAVATMASVGMAFSGFGAMSLILPQVAAQGIRGITYRWLLPKVGEGKIPRASRSRELLAPAMLLGLGQYAHNFVFVTDVLVLGALADEHQSGYFAFAFMLASQANAVISFQVGAVLQTALSKLQGDRVRQTTAYLRTLRSMAVVAIAICSTQAALGQLLFKVVFDGRWQPAALVFVSLSISQAFFFSAAPTMALFKAQGRFRTYLTWQVLQGVISVPLFAWLAVRGGALQVSIGTAVLWAASLTVAACVACRSSGVPVRSTMVVLIRPWIASLVVAPIVYLAALSLPSMPMAAGITAIGALALVGFAATLALNRVTYHEAWIDFASAFSQLTLRRGGTQKS